MRAEDVPVSSVYSGSGGMFIIDDVQHTESGIAFRLRAGRTDSGFWTSSVPKDLEMNIYVPDPDSPSQGG